MTGAFTQLWRLAGVALVVILITFSAIAGYDAYSARGISRLENKVTDLRDSVAIRDANAALADEQAAAQSGAIGALNDVVDRQRDSLAKVSTWADSVRTAARAARRHTHVVRGVDVDTLFLSDTPYVVAPRVVQHLEQLEGVIVADSLERLVSQRHIDSLTALTDSLFQRDMTRLEQIAERDRSIELRDGVIATQDTIIAKKNPRCGRKCGVAIGATGTVVVVRVVTWILEAFRGPR